MTKFKHGTYGSFAETIHANKPMSKRPATPSRTDTYVFTWDEPKVVGFDLTYCLVEGLTKELLDGGFNFTLDGIDSETGEAYTLTGTVPANDLTWKETDDVIVGTPTTALIALFAVIITLKDNVIMIEHDRYETVYPKAGVYVPSYADGLLGLMLGTERLSVQFLNGTIQAAN